MHQPSVRTEYEKRQLAFYRYFQELQKQEASDSMGRALLHFLREWFQFDLVWIAQYDSQYQVLRGIDGVLPNPERDPAFLRRKQQILPGDLFDQVLLTGKLQEIPSLRQEQRVGDWQPIAQRQNIQGTIILPIRYRHQPLGVLLVGTTLWGGHPRPEEMTELKMLAGALGAELYRSSISAVQSSLPQPQQPSMDVMSQILAAGTFEERLQLVLEQIHKTIQAARTCFYWIDADAQVCRLHEIYTAPPPRRLTATKTPPKIDLSLQSIASFYQSSLQNQVVAIADVQGLVKSNQAPTRLMTMTQSRAWLSAPILDRGRLIAILAVEENAPRLWSDTDKQSIQLMAQLIGQGHQQSAGGNLAFAKDDPFGLNGLLRILKESYSDTEQWDKTLRHTLEQLGIQFAVRWAAVFTHHPASRDFQCRAQFFNKKKHQPLMDRLPELSAVDAKMLTRLSGSMTVQSLQEDLRLLTWRQPLADRGVQSLLLIKVPPRSSIATIGSFLLLASDLPRTWTAEDIESVTHLAEPLGQALQQRNQWVKDTVQVQFMTVLNQGLQAIQQTPPGEGLFPATAQALQTLLAVECVVLLRWSPAQPKAQIAALINHSKFHIHEQVPILWETDGFLQSFIVSTPATETEPESAFPYLFTAQGAIEELTIENSGWLSGMGRVDLLAVPLKIYPEDPCLGLLLILDSRHQEWSDLQRQGIQLITRELTAHYRSHCLVERFRQKQETLECLNWYKQRHLEYISRLWTAQMSKFQVLLASETSASQPKNGGRNRNSHPVGELYNAFSGLESMLKSEVWDLQLELESIPVATLLRRTLERIEEVARTRQLWTQVHNLTPSVSLQIPGQKLELMLVELLLAACYRSKVGDRIDIWCRALPDQWVEISITDNGRLNPLLVKAIQHPNPALTVSASILETLPGLHFKICQSLIERLGGKIELAQLDDGRSLSRLILPIAPAVKA